MDAHHDTLARIEARLEKIEKVLARPPEHMLSWEGLASLMGVHKGTARRVVDEHADFPRPVLLYSSAGKDRPMLRWWPEEVRAWLEENREAEEC